MERAKPHLILCAHLMVWKHFVIKLSYLHFPVDRWYLVYNTNHAWPKILNKKKMINNKYIHAFSHTCDDFLIHQPHLLGFKEVLLGLSRFIIRKELWSFGFDLLSKNADTNYMYMCQSWFITWWTQTINAKLPLIRVYQGSSRTVRVYNSWRTVKFLVWFVYTNVDTDFKYVSVTVHHVVDTNHQSYSTIRVILG